jgi:hypothetical protein
MLNLPNLPFGFWLSLLALAGLAAYAWEHRAEAWGIPTIAVCGTVFAWYHCDALYNVDVDYGLRFSSDVRSAAWWQVTEFVAILAVLVRFVHSKVNPRNVYPSSTVVALLSGQDTLVTLQRPLRVGFGVAAGAWLTISAIALLQTGFDWQGLFAPWLGRLANPWARGRIGGELDFLFSVVSYTSISCLATFGVVAALSKSNKLRAAALGLMAVSWPTILFDRTRHAMIAIALPGLLCVVFLRLRRRPLAQVSVLLAAFLVTSWWFNFVMANRANRPIAEAFASGEALETKAEKHLGLNMLEELYYINTFLQDGSYRPHWGQRYFEDIANVVPRALWQNKPTIGLDYAVARGLSTDRSVQGLTTTIATGMIGGGVLSFGPWGGPPAAALLMSLWVAMLARFDLTGNRVGRTVLYLLGLVLTFNLGRDITLLVAYPLFFGYLLARFAESRMRASTISQRKKPAV